MKATLKSLFDRLCAWLHKVMSEDNGNPSSMRLVMVLWHGAVALVWTVLSICKRDLVHIDASILGLLTLTLGAKVGQKFGEADAPGAGPS